MYRHYKVENTETTITRGVITALTGSAMTPYELQSLSGEHKGVSIHVAHDVIANQTAKRGSVSKEESDFSNTTTWKLFNETGKEYQKAYSRKPILNKQTQLVELDRVYEDTDTETVTLKSALETREFIKPKKGKRPRQEETFEIHTQPVTRGRQLARHSNRPHSNHAPERRVVVIQEKTGAREGTHITHKVALAVHSAFDLAQTETLGGRIWVPGRAIPGSGCSGKAAGVG